MDNDMPSAARWSTHPSSDELKPGTRVYALYDYTGLNTDELSFQFDDMFVIEEALSLVEPGYVVSTCRSCCFLVLSRSFSFLLFFLRVLSPVCV